MITISTFSLPESINEKDSMMGVIALLIESFYVCM
jgi:hypothetical protein